MFQKPSTRLKWWAVYAVVGLGVGALLELVARWAELWVYDPRWVFYIVWIGAFGLAPATLALLLRNNRTASLFLVGSAIAFAAEALNLLVPGFGCSDCRSGCGGHLLFSDGAYDSTIELVTASFAELGLKTEVQTLKSLKSS